MLTLKTFDTSIEAHILKSRLENEGIPSYIFDENIMNLNPLYNTLVGGVKLKISELDLNRAQKILTEIDAKDVYDDEGRKIVCPRCSSSKFQAGYKSIKSFKGLVAFIVSLIFVVYPLYFKSMRKCLDCDLEF